MGASMPPEVADILARSVVVGQCLRLPEGQLDRTLYASTDRVLKALGGKWDRKLGGHVFPFDPAAKLADALSTGRAVSRQQTLQLFETPVDLARRMTAHLAITAADTCLEPSAGKGRIIEALRGAKRIVAVEIDVDNARALEAQSIADEVFVDDFLTVDLNERFSVIAMNPPFRANQDIKHVLHAFHHLAPGGRLAAIVSEHCFTGREAICVNWRQWLAEVGATVEPIPAGAFKESGTSVPTRLIYATHSGASNHAG